MKNATAFTEPIQAPGIRVGEIAHTIRGVKTIAIAAATNPDLDIQKAGVARLVPTAANKIITGILAPGSEWKRLLIINASAFNITLSDADALSAAANRFAMGGNFVLQAQRAMELVYDPTTLRWRAIQNEATFAS